MTPASGDGDATAAPLAATVNVALRAGAAQLEQAGVPDAMRDARRLMAHALQIAPDRLTLVLPDPMTAEAQARFDAALTARCARQPVSHITGTRAFYGRAFHVTPAVLDPRPETETLIAAALEHPFQRVLDLGTGSGCILLTLLAERAGATGLGVDLSEQALAVARGNARALDLAPRAAFALSDWFAGVDGAFDLIVANPPYIAADEMADLSPEVRLWEPAMALTPGGDGLDSYRTIAAGLLPHLAPDGRFICEIGPTQGPAVAGLLSGLSQEAPQILHDLDGRPRCVAIRGASGRGGKAAPGV